MKHRIMLLLLIVGFITFSVGMLWAYPITNSPNDGFEDYPAGYNQGGFTGGDPFAYYVNTGEFMDVYSGNNNNVGDVEDEIINWLNTYYPSYDTKDFTLLETTYAVTVDFYDYDGNLSTGATASGTYQVDTAIYSEGIEFYAVKASNAYALYYEKGGEDNGSWSTFDIWDAGYGGNSLDISHFTGYNGNNVPVPEPATMLLLGSGLLGLAGLGRKKFLKKR